MLSPFGSILAGASILNFRKVPKDNLASAKGLPFWTAVRLSGLFLISDNRSFVAGILGFFGVTQAIQARLAKIKARKY